MNLIIGSHVSFSKDLQLLGSVEEAISYNSSTFMFYTGAPQNTVRVEINDELTQKADLLMKENDINKENVVVHAPYIINMANDKNFDFNVEFLQKEIKRVQQLGIKKLVIHPGSHVNLGVENGINNIIKVLNTSISDSDNIIICLETMAGKGTEIGRNFNELKQIIDNVNCKDKIGICMDTCHLNDAGYNLEDFDSVLDEFNKEIGLDYLKVIHINDSKNILGSKKDRHENIGYGTIGFDNLINIIYNTKLENIPKILETPYVEKRPPYKEEILMIKNKQFNDKLIEDILN